MYGSQMVLKCLEKEGVDVLFGYPGGAVIPLFDALYEDKRFKVIRPVHEQMGTHEAEGYAKATNKIGVMIATSGPGATNTVTGIADAYLDSVPILVITGQVSKEGLGKNSFQEVNITEITKAITKKNYQITEGSQIAEVFKDAFYTLRTGRPGPVLIDITKNAFLEDIEEVPYEPKAVEKDLRQNDYAEVIDQIADEIKKAKRPVIYAGGGVLKAEASEELRDFAQSLNIPVANSIMGLGSFDRKSPLSYGIVGMHGDAETNSLIYSSDLLLGIGVKFSDRAIGKRDGFTENSKIVHIDTDQSEFNKNIDTDYTCLGDLKEILKTLKEKCQGVRFGQAEIKPRETLKEDVLPTQILNKLQEYYPDDTIVATDVGEHQMWTVRRWLFSKPNTLVTSGGLGTMGFGLGAAIGAKVAKRDKPVLLITGDGSFRMNQMELLTAVTNDIPLTVVVFDNHTLGMVRQWQALFNDRRYSSTDINDGLDINYLCKAYGANFLGHISTIGELDAILKNHDPMKGVNVIQFSLDHNLAAIPMVAAGTAINEIIDEVIY
ncbi:MAG: biosynthetic-type acetolactate synthase large subunit [Finegoldia sp.]|nr:biosynthetic-type acetolactate synthase large subunit [Finegoldia sp.]